MLTRAAKTYQLAKYSFNQGAAPSATVFTHISDNDLCLVIDEHADSPIAIRKSRFRIILRSDVLENIPVQQLAERANAIMQESQTHLYTKNHLPIWGVAKGQTLALQFSAPQMGQSKRMQVRFLHEADFVSVLEMLLNMGVQIERRPATSNSNSGATSRSTWSSPALGQYPATSPIKAPPLGMGELSRPQTSRPIETGDHFGQPPADARPQTIGARPSSPGTLMEPPPLPRPQTGSTDPMSPSHLPRTPGDGAFQWPSETMSRLVPPIRPLPPGFPSRPSSSVDAPEGGTSSRPQSKNQKPSSRPATRSRSNKSRAKATEVPPTPQRETPAPRASEPRARNTWHLDTMIRLDPPPIPANYNFSAGEPTVEGHASPPQSSHSPEASPSPSLRASRNAGLPRQHYDTLLAAIASDDGQQLAEYAAQTEEQRLAALDRFICENLRDPNFIALCQDVEACWRRVGIGMGM